MINIKKLFKISTVSVIILMGTASSVYAEKLRLGHVTPPSHIWHQVSERFNDNLKEASNSKDSIMIFPLSKLGGDDQMIDLLQSGALQLAVLTAGSLSNRSEAINAWFLPYLFKDVEDAAIATQSEGAQKILADLKDHKLIGLGYTLAGMRHVISSAPINSVNDFKGKKIRSFPNQVFNAWWSDLGAAPTALSIGDVSSALTTNLLDGVDVDLDIVVGLKMYQQAPYLTMTNHMAFPGIVVASEKWWNKLSDEKRAMVLLAFKEAEEWGYKQQIAAEVSNLELLDKAGVTINYMDSEKLHEVGRNIVSKYTEKNSETLEFVNQIYKEIN